VDDAGADKGSLRWLYASVSVGQLIAVVVGLLITVASTIGPAVITNESRVTKLEVAQDFNNKHSSAQDAMIESLRLNVSSTQITMAQIGIKLDILSSQLAQLNAALDGHKR